MLPQTKEAITALKQAGLERKQFRVRTPWMKKVQGYDLTEITLLSSYQELEPFLPNLAALFKTIVVYLDGKPRDVQLETNGTPGLYRFENGKEEQVTQHR